MGRPKGHDNREHEIRIKLNQEELDKLEEASYERDMPTMAKYIRWLITEDYEKVKKIIL